MLGRHDDDVNSVGSGLFGAQAATMSRLGSSSRTSLSGSSMGGYVERDNYNQ